MDAGWMGGIFCGAIGLAGGIIGTYFSVKNTDGPRERAFMIRVAAVTWVAVTTFLAALYLLPNPFRFLLWVPYGIALVAAIRWSNRRQQRIRAEEAAARKEAPV